ncbi:hypothetical protein Cni_G03461 [Canna indica]|uniref:Glycosyltransferase 61 catalytic domain-containing protein n=1 Tax=Canna indica TaxID=4628 RepID=A0AAQ3JRY5_9LILI|nr:hypothetical protein Cni_G03461 [Canna indica]
MLGYGGARIWQYLFFRQLLSSLQHQPVYTYKRRKLVQVDVNACAASSSSAKLSRMIKNAGPVQSMWTHHLKSSTKNHGESILTLARAKRPVSIARVRELTVKATSNGAPECTTTHRVPTVIFSTGGYTSNLFHDFTDLLVPLFATARQFNGEVMLAITDFSVKWMEKYCLVLEKISNYPVINLDEHPRLHQVHEEHILRVERGVAKHRGLLWSVAGLVIIAQRRTRAFTNTTEIVATAEELGYKVVEADTTVDLARFARVVNFGDVMMGVHVAGLTNMVFLPPNATLIQVVLWGELEWMAMVDFRRPTEEMGLKYEQFSIDVEESSLRE